MCSCWRGKPSVIGLLLCLLLSSQVRAQVDPGRPTTGLPTKRSPRYSVWFAGSVANGHVFGYAQDRQIGLLGAGVTLPLKRLKVGTFSYKVEVIPVALLSEPKLFRTDSTSLSRGRQLVYGAGASPVGFQFELNSTHRVQPFAEYTGGALYFQRRIFSPQASQFNFTVNFGGGVRWLPTKGPAISIGYKYLHISNANISAKNPGADFQLLYLALSNRRHEH